MGTLTKDLARTIQARLLSKLEAESQRHQVRPTRADTTLFSIRTETRSQDLETYTLVLVVGNWI